MRLKEKSFIKFSPGHEAEVSEGAVDDLQSFEDEVLEQLLKVLQLKATVLNFLSSSNKLEQAWARLLNKDN
jgi:hypothetical protein